LENFFNLQNAEIRELDKYKSEKTFDHVKNIHMIVPDYKGYETTYKFFEDHKKEGTKIKDWSQHVKKKKSEAVSLQQWLYIHRKKDGCVISEVDKKEDIELLKRAYIFMNEKRVVYGVPTHYGGIKEGEAFSPHLVGFTTTNSEIVKAFKHQFNALEEKFNNHDHTSK